MGRTGAAMTTSATAAKKTRAGMAPPVRCRQATDLHRARRHQARRRLGGISSGRQIRCLREIWCRESLHGRDAVLGVGALPLRPRHGRPRRAQLRSDAHSGRQRGHADTPKRGGSMRSARHFGQRDGVVIRVRCSNTNAQLKHSAGWITKRSPLVRADRLTCSRCAAISRSVAESIPDKSRSEKLPSRSASSSC